MTIKARNTAFFYSVKRLLISPASRAEVERIAAAVMHRIAQDRKNK